MAESFVHEQDYIVSSDWWTKNYFEWIKNIQLKVWFPIDKDIIVMNQGPYSWKILVLRVASSNNILRKFLEIWVFPLKI